MRRPRYLRRIIRTPDKIGRGNAPTENVFKTPKEIQEAFDALDKKAKEVAEQLRADGASNVEMREAFELYGKAKKDKDIGAMAAALADVKINWLDTHGVGDAGTADPAYQTFTITAVDTTAINGLVEVATTDYCFFVRRATYDEFEDYFAVGMDVMFSDEEMDGEDLLIENIAVRGDPDTGEYTQGGRGTHAAFLCIEIEEMGEADFKSEEDEDGWDEGEETVEYTEDEIKSMSKDELRSLVEDHDLPIRKYEDMSRLRLLRAILQALTE